MPNFRFSIRVEKHEEGYSAFCSELQGCYAQGESYEEAMEAIRDAVRLHVEDRLENGEEIPLILAPSQVNEVAILRGSP